MMVLYRDMCEHLRASCRSFTAAQVAECEEHSSDALETEIPKYVRAVVQERADEMSALLERVSTDTRALHDSVCEISQSINSVKESMREDVASIGQITDVIQPIVNGISTLHGALSSEQMQSVERLGQLEAAIETAKEVAKASNKTLLDKVEKLNAHAEKNVKHCEYFISGVKSLEATAKKDGIKAFVHDPVYIRGYKITPGVELRKNEESVSLHIRLQLHKGDLDDALVWPFEHNVRLTIVHPLAKEPHILEHKTSRHLEFYKKPATSSNGPVCFYVATVDLGELRQGGYVCDDDIRVVWELL